MLAIIIIIPRFILPSVMVVGDDKHATYYASEIPNNNIIISLALGLVLQCILIGFSEFFTSHYFQPTRDVALDTKQRATLGLMTVNIFSSNS